MQRPKATSDRLNPKKKLPMSHRFSQRPDSASISIADGKVQETRNLPFPTAFLKFISPFELYFHSFSVRFGTIGDDLRWNAMIRD